MKKNKSNQYSFLNKNANKLLKKYLFAFLVLFFFSCDDATFVIENRTSTNLEAVTWTDDVGVVYSFGTIEKDAKASLEVDSGKSPIKFMLPGNTTNYQTLGEVKVRKGGHLFDYGDKDFKFTDKTKVTAQ